MTPLFNIPQRTLLLSLLISTIIRATTAINNTETTSPKSSQVATNSNPSAICIDDPAYGSLQHSTPCLFALNLMRRWDKELPIDSEHITFVSSIQRGSPGVLETPRRYIYGEPPPSTPPLYNNTTDGWMGGEDQLMKRGPDDCVIALAMFQDVPEKYRPHGPEGPFFSRVTERFRVVTDAKMAYQSDCLDREHMPNTGWANAGKQRP